MQCNSWALPLCFMLSPIQQLSLALILRPLPYPLDRPFCLQSLPLSNLSCRILPCLSSLSIVSFVTLVSFKIWNDFHNLSIWVVLDKEQFYPRRGHLAISGDIFLCHNLGGDCYCHLVDRSMGVTKHPSMHRRAPHNKKKIMCPQMSIVLRLRNLVVELKDFHILVWTSLFDIIFDYFLTLRKFRLLPIYFICSILSHCLDFS